MPFVSVLSTAASATSGQWVLRFDRLRLAEPPRLALYTRGSLTPALSVLGCYVDPRRLQAVFLQLKQCLSQQRDVFLRNRKLESFNSYWVPGSTQCNYSLRMPIDVLAALLIVPQAPSRQRQFTWLLISLVHCRYFRNWICKVKWFKVTQHIWKHQFNHF